jgi:hypothetical protein
MQRTAFTALAAAAVATGALGIPAADAATLEQLISENFQFTFEDDSAETIIDRDNNGTVDEGDSLSGVVAYRSFIAQPSGTTFVLDGVQNSAVHGLFQLEVTEKTPTAGGFTYQFGPDEDFEEDFGNGAMIAVYEEEAPGTQLFPAECTSIAACQSAAQEGDLALVLGFDGEENAFGAGPLGDDLELARDFPPGANIAPYAFRMNVLENNVTDLPFIDVEGNSNIPGVGIVDFPAQAVGSGQILGTGGTDSPFPTFDDADVSLQVVPVPAALPLFLAGLGALGMIGWRRNAA